MGRILVRLLSLLLVLSSILTLSSCNRRINEEEVLSSARELLQEAEKLNFIYFGSGIEYYDDDTGNTGYYRQASNVHLDKLGFKTIDELVEMTDKVFSKEYAAIVYSTILSPLNDEGIILGQARYYQAKDEETGEPTNIMVYSKFTPILADKNEYDYNSLQIESVKKEKVHISVNVIVTNSEGKTQTQGVMVTLVEEEDGWRIDNPTYANYSELYDKYDELTK